MSWMDYLWLENKRSHQTKTVLNVMLNEVLPLLPHLSPLNIYETSTTLTDSHDTNMDSKHGSFPLLFSLFGGLSKCTC
jgi:hypothetical protein